MNIKQKFKYNPQFDITASQIGINKWDWISIDSCDADKALEIIKMHRFDVLPIVENNKSIQKYFSTQEWNNYSSLNKRNIEGAPKIYYLLSLRDLIRKFINDKERNHYYFLTDEKEVLGIVSYANMNCHLVYNYLYQVLSDIERSLALFLKKHISNLEIIDFFKKSTDKHLKDILDSYNTSIHNNQDNEIFQFLYLQTLGILLSEFKEKIPPKSKEILKYKVKFGPNNLYTTLRNKIMHPIKPIISDFDSLNQINELLDDYEKIKDILESDN